MLSVMWLSRNVLLETLNSEIPYFEDVLDFDLLPNPSAWTLYSNVMKSKLFLQGRVPMVAVRMLFDKLLSRYGLLENFNTEILLLENFNTEILLLEDVLVFEL